MFYRDSGELKTSYAQDHALLPVAQDRWSVAAFLVFAALVLPAIASTYWLGSIILPFLILALAAVGLNILTGYAGQISLGSGAFMAVGAYAAANIVIRLPALPFPFAIVAAGLVSGLVCMIFGLLSLRIRGLYVVVATLAAQFLIEWTCTHISWIYLDSPSGIVSTPAFSLFGLSASTIQARYLIALATVVPLVLMAQNLIRSSEGRAWVAVRDHETAATLTGINVTRAKLSAFALSGFFCGVSGALWTFLYLGNVDIEAFTMHRSFQILFMVIIGGLGSLLGSFLGAAFIVLLPVAITNFAGLFGGAIRADTLANLESMTFGAFIIMFLVLEPKGLARLAARMRERLRRWPQNY